MSDSALKNLVAATCVVIIAAIGWFALQSYQQSQSSSLDASLAQHDRLLKEVQRRSR